MTDFFSCAARFFVFRFVVFFLSFILTEMSLLSADETPSGAVAMPPEKQLSIQFVNKIYIPEEIGIIKEVVIPDKDKITELVICIQDAHCNYEAQMNINKIVKLFVEDYGIKLVNVEGSTGVIDTSPFSAFKDRKVKMDFADYFMKQGKITGPEYLSITSDLNFIIFGIENEDLYARNYTAFMNVQEYRDRINAYSTKLLERLNKLKESIFSPELLEVDREVTKFDEKTIDFEVYARFLEETALKYKIDLSPFENFNLQTKARIIEKEIDFKKVEEQREELISRFNTTLQGDKDKLRNIVHQSLAYKLREIDAETYYSFILNAAKENNINMEDLSHIAKYADYLHYYNTIDKMRLLDECGEVERHIKKALYKNPLEAELDHLSRIVSLIRKLFKLEVV
ncbi:MAG: hypothetical protein JW774_00340, partial [Candidatus Aureabacteria bacterium]|nr:hypothetical protein [Candidatus Auribacterota bacterium]